MKPGRNDPCPCGSGKKHKHCCGALNQPVAPLPSSIELSELVFLFNMGRFAEAESQARVLVQRYPHSGEAWKLLGTAQGVQGKNAIFALRKAAALLPDDAVVHYNLGNAQREAGQLEAAAASFRRALEIKPRFMEAANNLGTTLHDLGQPGAAVSAFRRALKINPNHAETHYNLGNALRDMGQLAAAAASYRRALEINPQDADAYNNLGAVLRGLGQLDAAEASYRRALKLRPDHAEAHNNLGNVLADLGRLDEAEASYRRALALKPDYAQAHSYLGIVLKDLGRFTEALVCAERALEIGPDDAGLHYNLGNVLLEIGRIAAAVTSYRQALAIRPDFIEARSSLLFALNSWGALSPPELLAEAREYGHLVAKRTKNRFTAWQCSNAPERLRVGLVSGDLRNHPVGFFLQGLLKQLKHSSLELFAYPTNRKADALTADIRQNCVAWRPLYDLSDEAAAHRIHADGVHVLLDLSGHTAYNRLPIFAWKPAPIQVSWLGYFATTGVTEMDYLLADEVSVTNSQQQHFTEAVWCLPDTRLCFTPPESAPPVASLPAAKNGYLTFGCFQSLVKAGDALLDEWGKIMNALPTARLRWQCRQFSDPAVRDIFVEKLRQHGIDPARVDLHGATSREDYLARYAEVDVILDTFPYPGGTTTCEALWMGVPTLTLAGDTLLSRQGASLLKAAGLEDWVATSQADYVAKAVALADELPKLALLRKTLRQQVSASPLCDAARFAGNLESALWEIWRRRQPI